MKPLIVTIATAAGLLAVSATYGQDSVEDFYRGKTVILQAGAGAGGSYDIIARLFARHMGQYIPGNPAIIVQNVPGGGSLPLANEFANITPRDGTVFGIMNNGMATIPLLNPDTVHFDPREFNFLGSPSRESQLLVVRGDADLETLDDLFEDELIVGALGPGSAPLDFALVANALAGTKFRIIPGYQSLTDIQMAMETGELDGNPAMSWGTARSQYLDQIEDGRLRIIAQYGSSPHPDLADVPLFPMGDDAEARQIYELMFARQDYGRPFLTPPEVPQDRLDALREAFEATMEDPEFLAEAETLSVEVNPVSWVELEELTERLYETPPEILDRVGAILATGQ